MPTPMARGRSPTRGKADARKFASGNGLRRSERSRCGCRTLRSHRPESRPAKNSALLRLPAPQTGGNNAANLQRSEPPEGDRGSVSRRRRRGACLFRGAGARTASAAGLGDRRCVSGRAYALGLPCSGESERLARWFGGKARRNPGRIPEGLEMPTPGQQLKGTAARGRPGRSPNRPKNAGTAFPAPGLSESATPCPESAAASSRQRPQEARREKKRTKQFCSVRLPDCYSAAFCAASARASASLARASASFRFAAASFSFASAS